jgi:hypothetical protein
VAKVWVLGEGGGGGGQGVSGCGKSVGAGVARGKRRRTGGEEWAPRRTGRGRGGARVGTTRRRCVRCVCTVSTGPTFVAPHTYTHTPPPPHAACAARFHGTRTVVPPRQPHPLACPSHSHIYVRIGESTRSSIFASLMVHPTTLASTLTARRRDSRSLPKLSLKSFTAVPTSPGHFSSAILSLLLSL